jgi:hypothetical protein
MKRRAARALMAGLAASWLLPCAVGAQTIRLVGRGDPDLDERLRAFITAGGFTLLANDTLIASGDTIDGPALALDARIRINGVIRGDLLIVEGNVFVQPQGRILGNVTNIAGGFYPSDLATITGEVLSLPNAPYNVERSDSTIRIVGQRRRSLLVLDGFRGIRLPTYDRVDGLTLGFGGGYYLPPFGTAEPLVRARLAYHTERRTFEGGLELDLISGPTILRAGASRATLTNEEWIRNALTNSASFLFLGKDYRNYYESDRLFISVDRNFGEDATTATASVGIQFENAESLLARDPFTFREPDSIRRNPPVDEGHITSFVLGLGLGLQRTTFIADLDAEVELAVDAPGFEGGFGRFELSGEWALQALANHALVIEGYFQGPLPGTDSLPHQRWTFVGGSGTLYTFDIAEFAGDRVAFVESEYIIPFPEQWRLPVLGSPSLGLLHHVGMAWSQDVNRDLEQNLGLRLRFPLVWARAVIDPSTAFDDLEFAVGVALWRRYPWQTRDELRD